MCKSVHILLKNASFAKVNEMRQYEDVGDYQAAKPIFESILTEYNAKRKPLQLVFFEDALEHLTRIHRTMRLPRV